MGRKPENSPRTRSRRRGSASPKGEPTRDLAKSYGVKRQHDFPARLDFVLMRAKTTARLM